MPDTDRPALPTARNVRIALVVGLLLLGGALALVLSGSPPVVAATNGVPAHLKVASADGGFRNCQPSRRLPAGTTAIRISASANTGPRITLTVRAHGRLITSGERDAGWGVEETVSVPVARVARTVSGARVCIAFGPVIEAIQLNGIKHGGLELRLEYLRPRGASWWSLASAVASRMGHGHVPAGTWVVIAVILLMAIVATLATRLVLSEMR